MIHVFPDFGQGFQKLPKFTAQGLHHFGGKLPAEKRGEGAHIVVDGHFVVIENDDEVFVDIARLIEPFKCHAGRKRTVPDDRDDFGGIPIQPFGTGNAQPGGNGSAAVAG